MLGPSSAFSPIHCDVSTSSASLRWHFFSDWIMYAVSSASLVVVSSCLRFEWILLFIDCTWRFPLIRSHLVYSRYFGSLLLSVLVLQLFFKPSWWSRSTPSLHRSQLGPSATLTDHMHDNLQLHGPLESPLYPVFSKIPRLSLNIVVLVQIWQVLDPYEV
jgi:hypothetical protein